MAAAPPRRIVLLVVAALTLVLFGGAVPLARATTDIGALRICTNCASSGGDLSRYRYVILNSWDWPLIPRLKAANPGLKALVYKNLSFSVDYSCSNGVDSAYLTTGVGYCSARANHPEWFLADTQAQRLASAQFPDAWMMDVGSASYQDQWLANVGADLRTHGWDGVFMDDTDASMDWHLGGRTIARYPTDSDWRTATRSMLSRVGPALASQGFLTVANLYAPWKPDYDAQVLWQDWIKLISGAAQEYYSKWGSGSSGWLTGSDWLYRQGFQTITQQAGKIFIGITYSAKSDTRSMAYARASFLLYADGAAGALVFETTDPEAQDPFASQWTADVGTPLGARYQVGSAWRRDFSGGTVLVNPSAAAVTVSLGAAYSLDGSPPQTSLTLGPASGAILQTVAPGAVQPAPSSGGTPQPAPGVTPPPASPPSSKKAPPPVKLRVKHQRRVTLLAWTGLRSARTTIFRNGSPIRTIRNTGSYRDRLSKAHARTLTYRVCAVGRSTCSTTVAVRVGSRPSGANALLLSAAYLRSLALPVV